MTSQSETAGQPARIAAAPAHDITDEEIERRFTYHPPSGEAQQRHKNLRADVKRFAYQLRELLPAGREKSLAFTALEEASYHAHAAIARDPSLHEVR